MATWTISAEDKKSTIERNKWTKSGRAIVRETLWRGGSFDIETTGDKPPEIDLANKDGIDVYRLPQEDVESVELNECFDSCCEEFEWPDDMDDEESERLQVLFDDGSYDVIESIEGWNQETTEMQLIGPLVLDSDTGNVVGDD